MIFKKILQSLLVLSSILLANPPGTCWLIDDQTETLYTFNMETLDAPIETAINQVNEGEGLAYRPSKHELYMWSYSQTIVRDANTGAVLRQYDTSYANGIEGASFYTNPISKEEELWVIVEENAENYLPRNLRYIQRVNIDTGIVIANTRKELHDGFTDNTVDYGNDIGSLAIDPKTKTFWITKDSSTRKIATINPLSGQITNVQTLTPEDIVDAEVLAFDINGIMYTESDRGDTNNDPRYLWKINPSNTSMTKATSQFGTGTNGDLEGMACNSGADTVEYDFGDAPDIFPHVSHKISSNLYLGDSIPDGEDDQQSSANATGDGADDNDGVTTLPILNMGDTSYTVEAKVFNNTGDDAYITAWIDFDKNGIFEFNEALNINDLSVASSASSQTVNIVWDDNFSKSQFNSLVAGTTIMRIRLSTSRVLRCDSEHNSTGNSISDNYFVSPDGEVEDYEIEIKAKGNPFECTNEGHIFNSSLRSQFTNGVTIDLENGNLGASTQFATRHINAAGYNVNDNFIYGMGFQNANHNLTELVKVDRDYNVTTFTVPGLVQTDDNGNELLYAYGDVSFDNKYYFTELGTLEKLRIIDLKTKTLLPSVPLVYPDTNSSKISSADYAFNPKDEMLYVVNSTNRQLTRIDPESGVVTELGNVGLGNEDIYSVVSFFDLKGNYYFNNSAANQTFKINISNPDDVNATATPYLSGFQLSTSGDGAKCAYSYISEKDYGDAPDSYPHVGHEVSSNLYFGDHAPDEEDDQQSSIDATGDGDDDNDGVINLVPLTIGSTSYSVAVKVYNRTGKNAYITAWIDFNKNGNFEANEALNNDLTIASSSIMQEATIVWNNPAQFNTLALGNSIMRIRISTTKIAPDNTESNSPDGEVEDYFIHIIENKKRGKFNIERTNSGSFPIMSDARNAWYTQIVGRDFDYSLVFYKDDFSAEQNISNLTVKVDLMDIDKNISIYDYSFHIPSTVNKSRMTILTADDLDKLPATRNARFKVTYGVDNQDQIIMADCLSTPSLCTEHRSDYAKDNFSIRPDNYYITINDNAVERLSSQDTPSSINLAAGYDYNLTAVATEYMSVKPARGYTKTFIKEYDLDTNGTCASHEPLVHTIDFVDGNHSANFSHDNVGKYIVDLYDNNWTKVDQNGNILGCIENSATKIADAQGKVGCDIDLYLNDIEVNFQPHHFAVNLAMNNLPGSGHPEFIYMMELNSTNNDVAIAFDGTISAQSENNITTTNFTAGCVAKNILFDLNTTTVSVEGNNTDIFTTGGTPVFFSRVIRFNDETNATQFNINNRLTSINANLPIGANRFLNENNGTMSLDMRFNLNKNIQEPTNPVEVTFNHLTVNSNDSMSVAHNIENYIPSGQQVINTTKNFYFARVVSTLDVYPRINMNINKLVRTPLHVDFFCKTDVSDYCEDRNVFANSNLTSTTREPNGWYISANHNGALDGNVTALLPNNPILTIRENGNLVTGTNNNIMLSNGSNGTVTANFIAPGTSTITIITSPVLTFDPSAYTPSATDVNASQWTGVGQTGHILEIKPQVNPSKKMDW